MRDSLGITSDVARQPRCLELQSGKGLGNLSVQDRSQVQRQSVESVDLLECYSLVEEYSAYCWNSRSHLDVSRDVKLASRLRLSSGSSHSLRGMLYRNSSEASWRCSSSKLANTTRTCENAFHFGRRPNSCGMRDCAIHMQRNWLDTKTDNPGIAARRDFVHRPLALSFLGSLLRSFGHHIKRAAGLEPF